MTSSSDTTREGLDCSDSFGDSGNSNDLNHQDNGAMHQHQQQNGGKKRKLKTLDDIVRKISKQNGGSCHQSDSVEVDGDLAGEPNSRSDDIVEESTVVPGEQQKEQKEDQIEVTFENGKPLFT